MTQAQLPEDIRKQIQQDLDKKYPFINNGNPEDIIATGAARAEYMDCAMKYAKIICIQKDEYISHLQNLLRFADCPELIIENPKFIIGKKPTDEDMEWARGKVKEYIKQEESKDEQIARLRKGLEDIAKWEFAGDGRKFDGNHKEVLKWVVSIATEALKQQ